MPFCFPVDYTFIFFSACGGIQHNVTGCLFFPSGCQFCLRQLLRSGTAAEDLGQWTTPLHPSQVKHLWCPHHSCAGGTFDYWGFVHQTWRSVRQYWGHPLIACMPVSVQVLSTSIEVLSIGSVSVQVLCFQSVLTPTLAHQYWGFVHHWGCACQYWGCTTVLRPSAICSCKSGYACQCWGSVHQYWGCAWGCPSVLRLSTFRLRLSMLRFCLSVLRLSISIEAIHL